MPLQLNVGLSRKKGEANYGSRGASVNLELELDSALINDPARLQDQIRKLFGLAKQSIEAELNGGSDPPQQPPHNGNGQPHGRPATQSQIRALHSIANRQGLNLVTETRSRFAKDRVEDLLIGEASALIDAIKPTNGNGTS